MGVLYDYFQAPDDTAVIDLMDRTEGEEPSQSVALKTIDPAVLVDELAGLIETRPAGGWSRDRLV